MAKKKVSKKNKSSWRKHSNVKDVEEFLHEQAEGERLGFISLKKDEELFTVDEVANTSSVSTCSPKQQRILNALKKPKSTAILGETQEDEIKTEILPQRLLKKALRGIENNKKNLLRTKGKKLKRGVSQFIKDVWDEQDLENDKAEEYKNEWISRNLILHNLQGTGRELVKVHQSAHHKTSRAKAFQPPHPGISYNPSFKDYKDLIDNIVEKETKIIKQQEHLDRVTTKMFSKVPIDECESFKNCEDPSEDNDDKSIKIEQDSSDEDTKNVHKLNKKKTKKARTKQKKVKELQKEQSLKKERKKQVTDLHRLKSIISDVSREQSEQNKLMKHRKIQKEKKKFEPKRLSKIKFEEPDADIVLPQDQAGNLRSLKCDSKLIVDKFKDFQKRNLLPVSVDVGTRKKHKVKRFVRKSHKGSQI